MGAGSSTRAFRFSRAGGSTVPQYTGVVAADGSRQQRVGAGSGLGSWVDQWPDAWLDDATAVYHTEGNGCGICVVLRVDASTGITRTLASGIEGASLAVDADSRTVALTGRRYGAIDPTVSMAPEITEGIELIDTEDGTTQMVFDRPCRVALWSTTGLPYVRLPMRNEERCSPAAFGPDRASLAIDAPPGLTEATVSPGNQWRLLYGESGWWLFDRSNTRRAEWSPGNGTRTSASSASVSQVGWQPDDDAMAWIVGQELWLVGLPNGEPVLAASWEGGGGPPVSLDVAWIAPR